MSENINKTLVNDLIENKAYVGTTNSNYFPKITDSFVMGKKNNQIVIDPYKIANSLMSAKGKIEEAKKEGKSILVVGDKEVFRDEIEEICSKNSISFLNNKVPSGIFTNFDTFVKRIHSMNKLDKFIKSEAFGKLTKKEQLMKKRELAKLEVVYKGVKGLNKLPELVIVLDAEYNLGTINELEKINIDYIAVSNTNLSRWLKTDNLVVANTNSYESMTYILNYLLN